MARSGRSVSAKRCRPGKKKRKTNRRRLIFVSDPKASSGFHAHENGTRAHMAKTENAVSFCCTKFVSERSSYMTLS